MLGLLDAKRGLTEGVLDRRGDLAEIRMPSSRAAFMERLNAVLGAQAEAAAAGAPRPLTAVEQLRDGLAVEHGATLRRIFVRENDETVLVVISCRPNVSPRKNAASIGDFVARVSRMVADMAAASRGAAR